MKKLLYAALAATAAVVVTPAMAQSVSGTVAVTGTVADKCVVTEDGTPPSGAFGGTVNLGALDDTDGRLRSSASLSASFAAAGTSNLSYRIVCTTPKTSVTVDASPLVTGASTQTGYANTVQYNANVAFALVGGTQTLSNDTTAAASATVYNDRLATGGATNVSVTADTFRTPGANDILLAGTYNGSIVITVAPAN